MEILYLSAMASREALKEAMEKAPSFSGHAIQKFTRLLMNGFVRNGHKVSALSSFFLPSVGSYYYRKSETEDGIHISYIPSLNFRLLRIICLLVYTFCKVLLWGVKGRKNKVVLCDVLNVSVCVGAIAASRLVRLRCAGLMTDMPGIGVSQTSSMTGQGGVPKLSLAAKINRSYLHKFTHYIFITEQMNNAVNTKHRPYIVMEGAVDADLIVSNFSGKEGKRIIIYAGGLYERYGLKMLVEGFIMANVEDTELWLYGNGPFVEELISFCRSDSRVIYKGIRPNEEIVEAELKASLLVNPRPTHEEFTQYSFPSKNLEYMVSGTPVLTTMLPGMPKEYLPYVYLFDRGETVEGYAEVLRRVLTLPDKDLREKGIMARRWIVENKNHILQTAKIVEMIRNN